MPWAARQVGLPRPPARGRRAAGEPAPSRRGAEPRGAGGGSGACCRRLPSPRPGDGRRGVGGCHRRCRSGGGRSLRAPRASPVLPPRPRLPTPSCGRAGLLSGEAPCPGGVPGFRGGPAPCRCLPCSAWRVGVLLTRDHTAACRRLY